MVYLGLYLIQHYTQLLNKHSIAFIFIMYTLKVFNTKKTQIG